MTSARRAAVSTITQQVAKNLFLWPGRSFVRKALELPIALWIDLVLPKWRVLEIYLNIAEWGPDGQFGAEAASRYAFNKSVRSLNAREAADPGGGAAESQAAQRQAPGAGGAPAGRRLRGARGAGELAACAGKYRLVQGHETGRAARGAGTVRGAGIRADPL